MIRVQGNDIFVTKRETGFVLFPFYSANGRPLVLDGYEVGVIIKENKSLPDSVAILNNTYTAQAIGDNYVKIPITESLTSREPTVFAYGIKLVKNGQTAYTLEGKFTIEQGVYR